MKTWIIEYEVPPTRGIFTLTCESSDTEDEILVRAEFHRVYPHRQIRSVCLHVPVEDTCSVITGEGSSSYTVPRAVANHIVELERAVASHKENAAHSQREEAKQLSKVRLLWGVLNAVRVKTRFGQCAPLNELLPRMNEVLEQAKDPHYEE